MAESIYPLLRRRRRKRRFRMPKAFAKGEPRTGSVPNVSPTSLKPTTRQAQQTEEERMSYGSWEVFHTCVVVAIILTVYIYFW